MKIKCQELLNKMKAIPGEKLITLSFSDGAMFRCEMKGEEFILGLDEYVLFLAKLARGMGDGAGLIVRQLLPIDGYKAIYGVLLCDNNWVSQTPDELREIYKDDSDQLIFKSF